MTEDKKLIAKFEWDDYRNDGATNIVAEVHDLADAAKFGTEKRADFFTTYTQSTVTHGGKTFTGDTEPQAGRHYLQQAKVYTPAEVLAGIKADEATTASVTAQLLDDLKRHGMGDLADKFAGSARTGNPLAEAAKKEPDTTRYAKLRYKGFVKLEDGETAWDAKGKQLWPVQPAAPKMKPLNEFDL